MIKRNIMLNKIKQFFLKEEAKPKIQHRRGVVCFEVSYFGSQPQDEYYEIEEIENLGKFSRCKAINADYQTKRKIESELIPHRAIIWHNSGESEGVGSCE
jgi:hypothetical protein